MRKLILCFLVFMILIFVFLKIQNLKAYQFYSKSGKNDPVILEIHNPYIFSVKALIKCDWDNRDKKFMSICWF